MFRTSRQRETEISNDRRHQGISHDQRWIRDFVMSRSRVPCPISQVSVSKLAVTLRGPAVFSYNCPLLLRAATDRARSECTSKTFEYHQLDWTCDEDQWELTTFLSRARIPASVL